MSITAINTARSFFYTQQALASLGLDDEGDEIEAVGPRSTDVGHDDDSDEDDGVPGVGSIIDVRA